MRAHEMSDCSIYEREVIVCGDVMRNNTFHIAFAINDKFAMGMGVCVQSIVDNNGNDFVVHILAMDLSMETVNRIKQANIITGVPFVIHVLRRDFLDAFPISDRYPKEVYYRLMLPKILFRKVDVVLYLDADTLCIGDVSEIRYLNLNEKIAGVIADRDDRISWLRSIGYANTKYFNSGVLLVNVNRWEEEGVTESAICFINKYASSLVFFDQDALNAVIGENVHWLEQKYNLLTYMYKRSEYNEMLIKSAIIHYGGEEPLWQEWCENPFQEQFVKYKENSAWKDVPMVLPQTTLQMRKNSKKCMNKGNWCLGIYWYIRYIIKKCVKLSGDC